MIYLLVILLTLLLTSILAVTVAAAGCWLFDPRGDLLRSNVSKISARIMFATLLFLGIVSQIAQSTGTYRELIVVHFKVLYGFTWISSVVLAGMGIVQLLLLLRYHRRNDIKGREQATEKGEEVAILESGDVDQPRPISIDWLTFYTIYSGIVATVLSSPTVISWTPFLAANQPGIIHFFSTLAQALFFLGGGALLCFSLMLSLHICYHICTGKWTSMRVWEERPKWYAERYPSHRNPSLPFMAGMFVQMIYWVLGLSFAAIEGFSLVMMARQTLEIVVMFEIVALGFVVVGKVLCRLWQWTGPTKGRRGGESV